MSKRIRPVIAVALVLAALVAVPASAQQTKFMYVTGKLFEGGGITPPEFTWGPNQVQMRNSVAGWYIVDPFGTAAGMLPSTPLDGVDRAVPGPVTFGINCNLDAIYFQGECWGTMEATVGDGGWTGTWSGKFDLGRLIAKITLTAHGTGAFAGKELKLEAMGPAKDADFYFLGEILGR